MEWSGGERVEFCSGMQVGVVGRVSVSWDGLGWVVVQCSAAVKVQVKSKVRW